MRDNDSLVGDRVHKFSISFRLQPTHERLGDEEPGMGCELELIGGHCIKGKHRNGGCPRCLEVLLVLLEVEDRTLAVHNSGGHINAQCDNLIRFASIAGNWPEVVLDVRIVPKRSFHVVSDDWAADVVRRLGQNC